MSSDIPWVTIGAERADRKSKPKDVELPHTGAEWRASAAEQCASQQLGSRIALTRGKARCYKPTAAAAYSRNSDLGDRARLCTAGSARGITSRRHRTPRHRDKSATKHKLSGRRSWCS